MTFFKKILTGVVVAPLLLVASVVFAAAPTGNTATSFSVFKNTVAVPKLSNIVPTVVEVSFKDIDIQQKGFLVKENETNTVLPSYFKDASVAVNESLVAQSVAGGTSKLLVDGNLLTAVAFPFTNAAPEETDIRIDSKNPITTSQLKITLPPNVVLPTTIAITARDAEGTYQTVVATKSLQTTVVNFPETTSNSWRITFAYEQPLRIAELAFTQSNAQIQEDQSLRFLAQPEKTYTIFYNPDQPFKALTAESGNLQSNTGVLKVVAGVPEQNPLYVVADVDGDGIADVVDNCPNTPNADQADIDGNGVGDKCDDFDKDSVLNSIDNCPNTPNYNQSDVDGDGIGDVCDTQESRLTERYAWVPWVGMGIALVVLIMLFAIVGLKPKVVEQTDVTGE